MRGALFLAVALALASPIGDGALIARPYIEPDPRPAARRRGRWAVELTSTVRSDDGHVWTSCMLTRWRSLREARAYARRMSGWRRIQEHDTLLRGRVRRWRRRFAGG